MEESGEQCTVVFAFIVTELAREYVEKEVRVIALPPPPTSQLRNNLCKDDNALLSRFFHAYSYKYRIASF